MDTVNFAQIFDAPLEKLIELNLELENRSTKSLYVEVLIAYLQNEVEKLELIVNKIEIETSLEDHSFLLQASKSRLEIVKREINHSTLANLKSLAEDKENKYWRGELYFILSYAFAQEQDHHKAKIYFKKSAKHLEKIGAKRKSVLAFQNFISAESNIHPQKKMIAEYSYLIKKASLISAHDVEGLAYLNLSREYQRVNAYQTALEYCLKAEKLLISNTGVIQYWLAKAHHCHLLLELDRHIEAKRVYEELLVCKQDEIQSSIKVIESMMSRESAHSLDSEKMAPTWRDRIKQENQSLPKLGALEESLLSFLALGPKNKYDIITHLYGDLIDNEALENRFKRLIARTRKKLPGLIIYEKGLYHIADHSIIQAIQDAS